MALNIPANVWLTVAMDALWKAKSAEGVERLAAQDLTLLRAYQAAEDALVAVERTSANAAARVQVPS